MELKEKISEIEQKCIDGEINPIDAVGSIDSLIGGITNVVFKDGLKFKIYNHNQIFALNCAAGKKLMKNIYGLAVAAYFKAKSNGSICPGEVHIDKGISTKHYMPGIINLYNEMLTFYVKGAA